MDLIKLICEEVVFNHWSYSEGKGLVTLPDHYRSDIINPLRFDLKGTWYLSRIEKKDLDRIFIISSQDWSDLGFCKPDFRLATSVSNYVKNNFEFDGPHAQALNDRISKLNQLKEYLNQRPLINFKLIMVTTDYKNGPYTLIEGNNRAIVLQCLDKIVGFEVFLYVYNKPEAYIFSNQSNI